MRSLVVDEVSVQVAVAGHGVKVGLNVIIESEPRPVGDTVFFFVNHDDAAARELSDQRAMEAALPDFEVSNYDIQAYGLPADSVGEDDDVENAGPEEEEGPESQEAIINDDEDDGEGDVRPLIVLKTDSGRVLAAYSIWGVRVD